MALTLLPAEEIRIGKGVKDVTARRHETCCMPLCTEKAVDPHHIVRRSYLSGPYDAVEIDGRVVPNIVTLCREHHRQLTENEARIMYEFDTFWWSEQDERDLSLKPQPEFEGEYPPADTEPEIAKPLARSLKRGTQLKPCPRCKGKGRLKVGEAEKKHGARRRYKTWSMGIPVDAGENGYEIWKTNLAACTQEIGDILGYTDDVPPYYVLVAVTADWLSGGRSEHQD